MAVRRPSRPRARRLAAAALVPALALLAACTGGDDDAPAAASGQELGIGLLAPLTGPNAAAGNEARRGAALAADVVNGLNPSIALPLAAEAGLPNVGGAKIKLVVEDVGKAGNPQVVAGDAVNRLVSAQGVDALVGAYDPLVTEYASQRSERYEVPFVNGDSPATYLTDAGRDWFFRIGPSWRSAGEAFFSLLREQPDAKKARAGRVIVLHAKDKAGQDVVSTVRELAAESGEATFLEPVAFDPAATDLQPEVDRLVRSQPDTVFLYVTPATIQPMIRAFATRAFKPKAAMSFSLGYVSADVLVPSGATAEGLLRSVSWGQEAAARNPAAQAVTQLYQRKYNTPMTEASAAAFTAVMTVAQAANAAGSTENQRMRSALLNLDVPGEQTIMPWSGIQFDETHQNVLAETLVEQYARRTFAIVHPRDAAAAGTALLYPASGASTG